MQHPFDTETFEQRRARIINQADELEWQHKRQLAEKRLLYSSQLMAGEWVEEGEWTPVDTEPRRLSSVDAINTPTRVRRVFKRPT